jgi:transposase
MGQAGGARCGISRRRRADCTERQELSELRRENRRLREDVEILKRTTAFFAKETR